MFEIVTFNCKKDIAPLKQPKVYIVVKKLLFKVSRGKLLKTFRNFLTRYC